MDQKKFFEIRFMSSSKLDMIKKDLTKQVLQRSTKTRLHLYDPPGKGDMEDNMNLGF